MTEQPLHTVERTSTRPADSASASLASAAAIVVPASKLRPPVARRGTVVRQALLGRLAEEMSAKLVLVVGPAGWGKTSLLRDWCLGNQGSRTAWLSLDPADNDPAYFWVGVIAAVNSVSPGIGDAALRVLMAPGIKTACAVLPPVINDFARIPAQVTLMIDDFHLITNPAIVECVKFLVEHLPPTLNLVVATRCDPPLPLARLRARGEMAEIRTDDLRFSEAEAAELLNETLGLALAPEDIHALQQRTEGWAAGLYMAGLSLRGRKDRAGIIQAFSGDDRQIVDYFAAEVLDGQPARVRSLLLRTSVLDRFCGALCDAVTGAGGSQGLLEELERSQLFLVPLDTRRQWYRYHSLFADLLRHELDRAEPGLTPLLHRRASAWHRQHGSIAEAIHHAILAADLDDARELIAAHWYSVVNEGQAETVESWLERLPPEMVIEDARMCLIRGFTAHYLGRLDDVEPWLEAAEATESKGPFTDGPSSIESAAVMLRAIYRHLIGDLAGAESASRRAAELEATGKDRWRALALANLGASQFWRGQNTGARMILGQVIGPTHPPANNLGSLWALGCLAAISARSGDLESCERYLHRAADLAARHHLGGSWLTATAVLTSAELLAGRGELAEAEAVALSALERAQRGQARLETACALLCLARIHSRAGNTADARARISQASDLIDNCPDPGTLPELLRETECLAGTDEPAPGPPRPRRASRSDGLTAREAQVLRLLAAGHTNNEIAADLVVSVHTVERHVQNAYRKIGVRNRADATAYIVRREG